MAFIHKALCLSLILFYFGGDGASTEEEKCNYEHIDQCVKGNWDMVKNLRGDEACNAKDCVAAVLLPSCHDEREVFGPYLDVLYDQCEKSCTMEGVAACKKDLNTAEKDNTKLCQSMNEAGMCLHKLQNDDCKENTKETIKEYKENLKSALEPDCCESLAKISGECAKEMIQHGFIAEPNQCL